MRVCPVCDFHNMDSAKRCIKCSALLEDDPAEVKKAFRKAMASGEPGFYLVIRGKLETLWRKNPFRRYWEIPTEYPHRMPFLAGALSLLPGLGQAYNCQRGKAIILGATWWIVGVICVLTLTHPWSNLILLSGLMYWLFIWNDAISTAARINGQQWGIRQTLAMFCGLMFFAGITVTGIQFVLPAAILFFLLLWASALRSNVSMDRAHWSVRISGVLVIGGVLLAAVVFMATGVRVSNVFSLIRVTKTSSYPVIKPGDLVVVNNFSYRLWEPKLGEIAFFDPAGFSIEKPGFPMNDIIAINMSNYFQRVCGLPGDKIVVKEGQVYRNGAIMPADLQPIGGSEIPDWHELTVPSGHFYIPVTYIPDDAIVAGVRGLKNVQLRDGILKKYQESVMVPASALLGRARAIANPPERRQFF